MPIFRESMKDVIIVVIRSRIGKSAVAARRHERTPLDFNRSSCPVSRLDPCGMGLSIHITSVTNLEVGLQLHRNESGIDGVATKGVAGSLVMRGMMQKEQCSGK